MPDSTTTRVFTIIDALPEDLVTTNRAPSDYELNVARTLILQYEEQIRTFHLDVRSSGDDEDLALLRNRIMDLRKVVSPIRRVPEDIIRQIFIICLHADAPYLSSMSRKRMPLLLTYISSELRKIAIDTPELWARFCIEMHGSGPKRTGPGQVLHSQADKVREWLRRSRDLSVCISMTHATIWSVLFRDAPPELDHDIINLVFSCHPRWKDISFEMSTNKSLVLSLLQKLTPTDVPRLQSITIDTTMWPRGDRSALYPMPILASHNLRRVSGFSFADLKVYSPDFPLASLTHLDCRVYAKNLDDIADFLRTIGQCLSLVTLKFTLADKLMFAAISPDSLMQDTIHLPRLQSLLASEHSTLVSAFITAPLLESFYQSNGVFGDPVLPSIMSPIKGSQNITILGLNTDITASLFVDVLRCCPRLKILLANPYLVRFSGEVFRSFEDILTKFTDDNNPLCPQLEKLYAYNMVVVDDDIFRESLLRKLEQSSHFAQWKRVFIQVSYDGTLRSTLQTILDKFSNHTKIKLELHHPHSRLSSELTGFSYELYVKYNSLTRCTG